MICACSQLMIESGADELEFVRDGGFQYHRASPGGRFLKRFMLHMYWLG